MWKEVARERIKERKDVLHNLYYSPNTVRVIISRIKLTEHAACMGSVKVRKWFWCGDLSERDHLKT